jgi:NADH:quinone reductase (non-electrogenic)
MAWNVLILGGGFGGLYAARKLERALPAHAAKVTVVTDAANAHETAAEPTVPR